MKIEVIRAYPDRAEAVTVSLPAGATVKDALKISGLGDPAKEVVGVFGKRVTLDQRLADGDRVEIYRPLAMDPKEARRQRARTQRSRTRR